MKEYLQSSPTIDFEAEEVADFTNNNMAKSSDPVKKAINFYYAVRDSIRYDPYSIDMSIDGLKASTTVHNQRGWCVAKAIVLAACCRATGIPARLGFADVRNHLSTERMRNLMKTDIFFWHGYTSIFLNNEWVKATPAFNIELCRKFRIQPLDFDGKNDSIYHPFDLDGNKHMEYIRYRGESAEVPIERMMETFMREYAPDLSLKEADFDADTEQETRGG